jgi:TPP-dependent trihydroxycyclohexane-1,2-dione (THcHDO) dehydratase
VIAGDGGFQLNLQELGTAAQYGISVIVLLFNDGAWGVLRDRQRDYFGGVLRYRRRTQQELVHTELLRRVCNRREMSCLAKCVARQFRHDIRTAAT